MQSKIVPNKLPCWACLTQHAVEQFIRRWAPTKAQEEAAEELVSLLNTAKQMGKACAGGSIWVSGHRPEIRMVVKDRNVCVTVLPPGKNNKYVESFEEAYAFFQEEMEESRLNYEAHMARQNELKKDESNKLKEQIQAMEDSIAVLDEERKRLGAMKSELHNEVSALKQKLKQLLMFTDL
jgi:hypothetical protein